MQGTAKTASTIKTMIIRFMIKPKTLRRSAEPEFDCDIAARGLRIRADLVRRINQRARLVGINTGQTDVQARLQVKGVISHSEIYFSGDGRIRWQPDSLRGGGLSQGADKAG